jgi:hypothetical protein
MSDETVTRVRYFDRQFLRTEDFVDEQAYHLALRRRHDVGHHVWGIVAGLEPMADADGNLSVNPGVAVDGYGRTLVLAERAFLPTLAFDDKASEELDVWLLYDRTGSDRSPRGFADCGEEGSFYRWQERPLVRFDVPDPAFPDPREPKSVPPEDLHFDPSRTPPDEVSRDWPVFLGRIRRDRRDPKKTKYAVDLTRRPWVGLVGAALEAPWDRTVRVELGGDQQAGPARFAVFPQPDLPPALGIDGDGAFELQGSMTLHGELEIRDGFLELGVVEDGPPVEEAPRPWRIYRHGADPGTEELRIEMGIGTNGTGGSSASQVAVGAWSAKEKQFLPCLTVRQDGARCVVIVHGNLVVDGDLQVQSLEAARRLSEETEQFRLASFLSGIGGSNIFLQQVPGFAGAPMPAMAPMTPMAPMAPMPAPDVLGSVIDALAADPAVREGFARRVRERSGDLAESLRDDLVPKGE